MMIDTAKLKEWLYAAERSQLGLDQNQLQELIEYAMKPEPVEVSILLGPVGPAQVFSSYSDAIEECRKRNARNRGEGGINPRYQVEKWIVQR